MLFLAASKGNYFQWNPEHDVVMRSPYRGQIWENIAAAVNSLQQPKFGVTASQELFEIGIHFNTKTKTKPVRRRESLQNRLIQVVKNNYFAIVDLTIVIAYEMQIAEAFECHNKTSCTITRQTSSQRKSRRLSAKLHRLNFVFPAENETPGPVCLGYEASSSSVSLSMLKVPIICPHMTKTARGRQIF